jgi:glycosyltransferase involved in cell wall biosynthesis
LIAVNDDLADVFDRFGVDYQRIAKILPFVQTPPDPAIEIPPAMTEFLARHTPVLLAVGGLEPDYDPLFQIGAMAKIVKELPKAGLILVGGGSMRQKVEKAVVESPASSSIMLAGNIEHPITLHLIQRSDMLLRTTLFDGDAISVREALFLGTPVIATDNGMRPEGVNLLAIGDADRLVQLVTEIAAKPKSRNPLPAADRSNIDRVIDLYHELT